MRTLTLLLLLSLLATACTKSCDKSSEEEEIPPAGIAGSARPGSINLNNPPVDEADKKALAEAQKNRRVLRGKVVEAIYKEGFAYVRLEMGNDASTWVAIVNQKPAVGENIAVQEQAVLNDFHSKSLDRTFAKIVFGSIVD